MAPGYGGGQPDGQPPRAQGVDPPTVAGEPAYPNLKVEAAQEHPNPEDGDQKTDAAERASSTQSGASGVGNHAGGGGAGSAPSGGTMGALHDA